MKMEKTLFQKMRKLMKILKLMMKLKINFNSTKFNNNLLMSENKIKANFGKSLKTT